MSKLTELEILELFELAEDAILYAPEWVKEKYHYGEDILKFRKKLYPKLTPSFYFMKDNHTFIKIMPNSIDDLETQVINIAKQNNYGMLCAPKILDEDRKEVRGLKNHCYVNSKGEYKNDDLNNYLEEIKNDSVIMDYFHKIQLNNISNDIQ